MSKVKICGIKREEDLLKALEYGADAIGFNFVKSSPRYIEPEIAKKLSNLIPINVLKVGVFVDEPLEELFRITKIVNLDALQLHGCETLAYCKQISGYKIIKAFRLKSDTEFSMLESYLQVADYLLIDAYQQGLAGGTGLEIEAELLRKYQSQNLFSKTFLAGGLTPANVAERVKNYSPYAVDVASGVEESPGVKSASKMKEFISVVKNNKG